MSDEVDNELDRLLSGGGLSVQEEESVLAAVLHEVDQPAPVSSASSASEVSKPGWLERLRAWWFLPPALAAAGAAFLLWPRSAPDDEEWKTRGGGAAAAVVPRVSCGEAACQAGATAVITYRPTLTGWLSGAALGPDASLVWLFQAERVEAGQAFAYEATLPKDLAAGEYEVVILSSTGSEPRRATLLPRLEAWAEGGERAKGASASLVIAPGAPGPAVEEGGR